MSFLLEWLTVISDGDLNYYFSEILSVPTLTNLKNEYGFFSQTFEVQTS